MKAYSVSFAMLAVFVAGIATVQAVQFSTLDPNFTQQIYTGPLVGGPGMAWTTSGNLLTLAGSNILEYDLPASATHQGTAIHPVILTHTITGLNPSAAGMVKGLNGYIYVPTSTGLQRVNPNNWAAAVPLAGTVGGQGYGITVLPDGRIAYVGGYGTDEVYLYNPSNGSNNLIYTNGSLIDDIEAGPGGVIALAGQVAANIVVISNTGSVINSFAANGHYPDGLAFGTGSMGTSIFSNNNDGTITQFILGAGWTGVPTAIDIATGSAAYGDLAAVGPDCAFYVSQFDNGGYHGSTPGIGTHWDNGVTNNEPSIIRIGAASRPDGGAAECLFYNVYETVPEPATITLFGAAAMAMFGRRRRG